MELVWPRSFMVWRRCDWLHSWYGVDAIWHAAVPEFIDRVFTKTSRKRSFSLNRKRAFWLVFAKTGSIISGTGVIPQSHFMWFLCTLYSVHYTIIIHLADFENIMLRNPQISHVKTQPRLMTCKNRGHLVKTIKVTLPSWCDLIKWPYGVKKGVVTLTSQCDFRSYSAASKGFLLILRWRPFKMR